MKRSVKKIVEKSTDISYVTGIAKELGVHRTTIYGWFNGKRPSPMATRLLQAQFPEFYQEVMKCHKKIGMLTIVKQGKIVTHFDGKRNRTIKYTVCQCDCGKIVEVMNNNLFRRPNVSCGCQKGFKIGPRKEKRGINLTGQVFGNFTVVKEVESRRTTKGKLLRYWRIRCKCGKEREAFQDHLRQAGQTHKIKCERCSTEQTRLLSIYYGMLHRCSKNSQVARHYKDRGVTVCNEWLDPITGFNNFKSWALTKGCYAPGRELDKEAVIQNNLIYGPETCLFVSRAENRARKRKKRGTSSKYIGVTITNTGKKFAAAVKWRSKVTYLGNFDDEKDAAVARDAFIRKNNLPHTLNFPELVNEQAV